MLDTKQKQSPKFEHAVPFFWPLTLAAEMGEEGMALYKRNLDFVDEVVKEDPWLASPWGSRTGTT